MKHTLFAAALGLLICGCVPAQVDRGTLHLINLGGTQSYYLVETNTHLCALAWGEAVIAVDCATLAASVPAAATFITWVPTAAPKVPEEPAPAPALPAPAPPS